MFSSLFIVMQKKRLKGLIFFDFKVVTYVWYIYGIVSRESNVSALLVDTLELLYRFAVYLYNMYICLHN